MRFEVSVLRRRSIRKCFFPAALAVCNLGHASGSQASEAIFAGTVARSSKTQGAHRTVIWKGHERRHQQNASARSNHADHAGSSTGFRQQQASVGLGARHAMDEAEKLGVPSAIRASATLEPTFVLYAEEQQCNSSGTRNRIALMQTEQLSDCRQRCVDANGCSHISFSKENQTCFVWSSCESLAASRSTQTFVKLMLLAGDEKPLHTQGSYRALGEHRQCGNGAVRMSGTTQATQSKAHPSMRECESHCTGRSDCLFAQYNNMSRQCDLFSECQNLETANETVVLAKTSVHQVPDDYQVFDFSSVATSNLGGLGPDAGSPSVHYESVVTVQGREVDLIVRNISEYEPFVSHYNGAHNQYGSINVKSGTSVDLLFQFVDHHTQEPQALENYFVTFANVDTGAEGAGLLSIRAANVDGLIVVNNTELDSQMFPNGGVAFGGLSKKGFQEMPGDAFRLSAEELRHAATLNMKKVSQMLLTVSVASGQEGHDIIFTGFTREVNKTTKDTAQPTFLFENELRASPKYQQESLIDHHEIQVFQCGSEAHRPEFGCPECAMTTTCLCDGLVRFGNAEIFTPWRRVHGEVSCSTAEFGDPYPGHAKICVCRPDPDVLVPVDPAGAPSKWPLLLVAGAFFLVHACHRVSIVAGHVLPKSRLGPWYPLLMAVLEEAMPATSFAPMLCVAFVAATKRAATLAAGQAQAHHLPEAHLHISIATCSMAFCVQAFGCAGTVCLNALGIAALPFAVVFHVAVFLMFGALGFLVTATLWMTQPQDVFAHHGRVPVATGTVCSILLVMMYFGAYFLLHLRNFVAPFAAIAAQTAAAMPPSPTPSRDGRSRLAAVSAAATAAAAAGIPVWLHSPMWPSSRRVKAAAAEATNAVVSSAAPWRTAASAANVAPALGIVFLAAQIAADAGGVKIAFSVAVCMWVATISVGVMLLMVPIVPFLSRLLDSKPTPDGVLNGIIRQRFARAICWLSMAAMYLAVGIIFSCEISLPRMLLMTQGLSISAGLFFFVYFLFFLVMTARAVGFIDLTLATKWLELAQDAVEACPMYAAAFLIYCWGWLLQFGSNNGYGQGSNAGFAIVALMAVGLQAATIFFYDGAHDGEAASAIWFSDGSLDREAATFKVDVGKGGDGHAPVGRASCNGMRGGSAGLRSASGPWAAAMAAAAAGKEARRNLDSWDEEFRSTSISRSAAKAALPTSLSQLHGPWGRGAGDAAVAATLAASFAPPTPSYTPPVADLPHAAYKELAHPVLIEKMRQGF